MANTLDKIKLSGVTYDIIDSTAVHSLDGYYTSGQTNDAITAATSALAESIAEQGYQTSGDVQNAISGKVDNDIYTAYTAATDTILGNKADISDIPSVSGYADAVKYNDTSHYMEFYHNGTGGTKVYEFDASPFLIDGMVQNVEIKDVTTTESYTNIEGEEHLFSGGATYNFVVNVQEGWLANNGNDIIFYEHTGESDVIDVWSGNGGITVSGPGTATLSGNTIYVTVTGGTPFDKVIATEGFNLVDSIQAVYTETCLVISFNTDAGKQDINIPLSQIFDPSNYYTKTEVNGIVNGINGNISTISGNVSTLSGTVSGMNETLTAHTADTTIHVTSTDKTTWSGKQDALVSGTNIKTINNESILGSGNITVQTLPTVSGTTLVFS